MGSVIISPSNTVSMQYQLSLWLAAPTSNIQLRNDISYSTHIRPTNTNINMGYYRGTTLFWLRIWTNNTTLGSVAITYPFSSSVNGAGYSNQVRSASATYLTLNANPVYGAIFLGWYSALFGGTLLSTSAVWSPTYYNSVYSNYDNIYARFDTGLTAFGMYAEPGSYYPDCGQTIGYTSKYHNGAGPYPVATNIVYNSFGVPYDGGNYWYRVPADPAAIKIGTDGVVNTRSPC